MNAPRQSKAKIKFTLTDNVPAGQVVAVPPAALLSWARGAGRSLIETAIERVKARGARADETS